VTDEFEAHRDHLTGVAYRMLGSRAEAEDAVQETYLRYAGANREEIRDLRAWLTTTVARICVDVLRSARVRRNAYVGPWLPEPIVERLPAPAADSDPAAGGDPAEHAARHADVSLALLVVLETLTPEQRVAFVLHDVFAVPFEAVATALDTTPEAARQLASRARRAVATGQRRHTASQAEQRRVVAAFLEAVGGGDLQRLLDLLAPDVVAIGDGGGLMPAARRPVLGASNVARFFVGLFDKGRRDSLRAVIEPVLINGDFGLLMETDPPPVRVLIGFAVDDGHITAIFNQLNPDKLAQVPAADPVRGMVLM
jgi:RNA polymerase sigma-70 factor, ECF subfamily